MNHGVTSRLSGVAIQESVMQKKHRATLYRMDEKDDAIQVILLRRIRNAAAAKTQ